MTATKKPDLSALVPELEYSATFVPWSQSRNAAEKPCLNWKVTIKTPRGEIITDYMQGIGHLPGYKHPRYESADMALEAKNAAEVGRWQGRKVALPDVADVMHCLLSDAEVIDCASFEEWAENYGMDTDSRKAEATYRTCLETALKLRSMLGDSKMTELREAFQDY